MVNKTPRQDSRSLCREDALELTIRHKALTLALMHYKKINFTGNPDKIIELAKSFYIFLSGSASCK